MDSKRFDDLAKASGGTRRGVLRALAAGTLGAAFGGRALGTAARQREISTTAYDLTCRQAGTQFYCRSGSAPGTSCKNSTSGCVCALTKENKAKCIEQPSGGCPKKSEKCRRNKDCAAGEVCVTFPSCCPKGSRGKCVKECPL